VLKDQKLPFCSLDEDLLGIVAFDGSGDGLASLYQADNDLLAFELWDELWAVSLCDTFCFFDPGLWA
jgi:hypothetical protein